METPLAIERTLLGPGHDLVRQPGSPCRSDNTEQHETRHCDTRADPSEDQVLPSRPWPQVDHQHGETAQHEQAAQPATAAYRSLGPVCLFGRRRGSRRHERHPQRDSEGSGESHRMTHGGSVNLRRSTRTRCWLRDGEERAR